MLPAGILAFMLPVEPEEGFYADPPIQRWMGWQIALIKAKVEGSLNTLGIFCNGCKGKSSFTAQESRLIARYSLLMRGLG